MTDTTPATSRVQPDLPWPGLAAYTEADTALFFGRSRESAELLRLVQRDPFVLLTGAAGTGKTSLLLAGLFPALRTAEFLPVHVRIDFGDEHGETPLSRQILDALSTAARTVSIDGGRTNDTDTLWEAFHRAGQRWWSARQQVIVPVLVLDQAEELFSLGRESLRRRQRTERLIEELAQLVENRAPARVATLLETGEDKHDAFDFESAPVRIVLSVREESLAHLAALRGLFPTMGRSHLRVLPFTTAQAREAIAKPAAANSLLGEGAADAIVRFLAGAVGAESPVPPCLLSVLGRELAVERQRRGSTPITAELLPASLALLPRGLYERAFNGLPADARRFVEDDLVTATGTTTSCSIAKATARPEVTEAVLTTLVERQVIRITGHADTARVELSSELLCPIAVESRAATALTTREEITARDRATYEQNTAALRRAVASNHRWAIVFAVLAAVALAAAAAAVVLWLLAEQKLTRERENADLFLSKTERPSVPEIIVPISDPESKPPAGVPKPATPIVSTIRPIETPPPTTPVPTTPAPTTPAPPPPISEPVPVPREVEADRTPAHPSPRRESEPAPVQRKPKEPVKEPKESFLNERAAHPSPPARAATPTHPTPLRDAASPLAR